MSRFLFFAHDPGGAMMLAAVVPHARANGHAIAFAGAGPAVGLWRDAGHDVTETDGDALSVPDGIDAVVTGTGFSDQERTAWRRAREAGVASLAVIDAWTNLTRRFEQGGGHLMPNAVGVLDDGSRDELAGQPWWTAELFVVGQPHLQVQTAALAAARRSGHRAGGPLVFFSEPVREDYGDSRGFDQFEVFSMLADTTGGFGGRDVLIKPHPREDAGAWRALSGGRVALSSAAAPDLLTTADGVLGMTTMVLVEAHLLGLPVLSVQPARTGIANPLIDDIAPPVVSHETLPAAWAAFAAKLGSAEPVKPRFAELLEAADARTVAAMETAPSLARDA